MKNVLFFLFFTAFAWTACKNDGTDAVREIRGGDGPNSALIRNPVSADLPLDTNKLARITYEEEIHDFGNVLEGTVVEHTFQFKNTGKVPLTILNARSSCGCTIPEWPKEQIPPGGTGAISAKFNTEGKTKEQRKWIYVTANTYPNETKVLLQGIVEPN
ncbi:MAG: DUF1573 domain-containing protein [Saprospiraceae bacterium]|jgi:hypothetical protein|nr:DUF1573 domain-containing protein [Saprospiraceae bacterium]